MFAMGWDCSALRLSVSKCFYKHLLEGETGAPCGLYALPCISSIEIYSTVTWRKTLHFLLTITQYLKLTCYHSNNQFLEQIVENCKGFFLLGAELSQYLLDIFSQSLHLMVGIESKPFTDMFTDVAMAFSLPLLKICVEIGPISFEIIIGFISAWCMSLLFHDTKLVHKSFALCRGITDSC